MTGRVFDIQRFAIHDGPGIRTTVFLKGCPLRCRWCSNPESLTLEPLLSYDAARCIGCGECLRACAASALRMPEGGGAAVLDRGRCTVCGACAPVCAPAALEVVGRDMTVAEVIEIALRDRAHYEESGGGLTLSGGEPLFQPEFAAALLERAKIVGLHTCVETSGHAPWGALARLVPHTDLWLYDVKETDPARHREFTGESNETILENLQRLHDAGAAIVMRCPMIPRHNARDEHLDGLARLAARLPRLRGVELLPYFDLWRAKLPRLGLATTFPADVRAPDRETVKGWIERLRARGVPVIG